MSTSRNKPCLLFVTSSEPNVVQKQKVLGKDKQVKNGTGFLTAEERARIIDIQDLLIGLFVEHREAVENGDNRRARLLQSEIDDLLLEKEEIEKWAVVGSA